MLIIEIKLFFFIIKTVDFNYNYFKFYTYELVVKYANCVTFYPNCNKYNETQKNKRRCDMYVTLK
jgi:hypothetical protein